MHVLLASFRARDDRFGGQLAAAWCLVAAWCIIWITELVVWVVEHCCSLVARFTPGSLIVVVDIELALSFARVFPSHAISHASIVGWFAKTFWIALERNREKVYWKKNEFLQSNCNYANKKRWVKSSEKHEWRRANGIHRGSTRCTICQCTAGTNQNKKWFLCDSLFAPIISLVSGRGVLFCLVGWCFHGLPLLGLSKHRALSGQSKHDIIDVIHHHHDQP